MAASPNPPFPSFVKIFYHSEFAPHVMTIPAKQYAGLGLNTPGTFQNWASGAVAGDTMIEALIALLVPAFNTDVTFDRYEIWTKASPTAEPMLAYQKIHSVTGTGTFTGWNEAVQRTYFLRATDNGAFKLILLDSPTDNLFGKYYSLTSLEVAFINALTLSTNGWQSRSGAQPAAFKALTITLNNRLRREYHLR